MMDEVKIVDSKVSRRVATVYGLMKADNAAKEHMELFNGQMLPSKMALGITRLGLATVVEGLLKQHSHVFLEAPPTLTGP